MPRDQIEIVNTLNMNNKTKIDIIIPVYYALELVLRCIDSVIKSYDIDLYDTAIIVVDDTGEDKFNDLFVTLMKQNSMFEKVVYIKHDVNKGFIEACYTGIEHRDSEYKLLLNSDTFVMQGWLEEMVKTAESDDLIALVNPITNNSPIIDVEMPQGFNINLMHSFFKENVVPKDAYIDVVAATGFCLLIKDKYIKTYGFLDRIYDKGYCEETDLYFRYTTQGLRSVLAVNAFVYHRGEASFSDRDKRLQDNFKILMSRYKSVYEGSLSKFKRDSILNKLREDVQKIKNGKIDVLIFSPINVITGGGLKILSNICNALNESGISSNFVSIHYEPTGLLQDQLFETIQYHELKTFELQPEILVFSLDYNALEVSDYAEYIYEKHGYLPRIVHLVQDNEGWFEDNSELHFEACSNIAVSKLIISPFIANLFKNRLNLDSHWKIIKNSVSLDFLKTKQKEQRQRVVLCAMMRLDQKRGALVIEEALKNLSTRLSKNVDFVYFGDYKIETKIANINLFYKGVCSEKQVAEVLSNSDIFIEASYFQGFGMTSFEALLSGCKVIASNNFGASSILPKIEDVVYFKIGDSNDLSNKINEIIEKKSFVITSNNSYINEISSRHVFPKYVDYFKEVLSLEVDQTRYHQKVSNLRKILLSDLSVNSQNISQHVTVANIIWNNNGFGRTFIVIWILKSYKFIVKVLNKTGGKKVLKLLSKLR